MSSAPVSQRVVARQRAGMLEGLFRDLRHAVRTLGRAPGYAFAAVSVLALGIGANTAIFSAVRAVLLEPLPFRDGDHLVLVKQASANGHVPNARVSVPELNNYRSRLHGVRDLVEYHNMSFTLLRHGDPDRVETGVVSTNFFPMLGVRPLLGRTFVTQDGSHGAEAVLVLSYPYWQRKFGGDPHVVGRVVEMNNRPHTIVGVLPDFPQYPAANDVYMPTSACPFRSKADDPVEQMSGMPGMASGFRTFAGLEVFGRLTPGVSPRAAAAEVDAIARGLSAAHPVDYRRTGVLVGRLESLRESLSHEARPMLLALSAVTGLVLLLACANLANLALARAARRHRELAVRRALGASGGDIFRQLLAESMLVALMGGLLGLALAWAANGLLVDFVARLSPRGAQISLDGTVLTFALALSLVTGFLFGTLPAMVLRRDLAMAVRQGSAQAGSRQRLRSTLVVGQVAISFALLVGTALLLSSLYRLATVRLGYETRHVLTASFFGNFTSMDTPEHTLRIQSDILDRVRAIPGVSEAALSPSVPLSPHSTPGLRMVHVEGTTGSGFGVDPNVASEGYFETLGVRMVAGRSFRRGDDGHAPDVVVINQSLARLLGHRDPVGTRILDESTPPLADGAPRWMTVIGVVEDFQLYRPDLAVMPQYYVSFRQDAAPGNYAGRVLLRTARDPSELARPLAVAIHGVDPDSPVADVQTLEEMRRDHLTAPRVTATLLAFSALVALAITLAGIAGVIGTSVAQRTRELAIRLALGASRASVLGLVLGEGALLIAVGLLLGAFGAHGLGRLLGGYLFDTPPHAPTAYAAGVALLAAGALLAMFAPARRATSTEPMLTLRTD